MGNIEFTPEELYSSGKPMQEVFWLPVEPKWFSIASQLQVYLHGPVKLIDLPLCGQSISTR